MNLFQLLVDIGNPTKAWRKLDAVRIRLKQETPELHAKKKSSGQRKSNFSPNSGWIFGTLCSRSDKSFPKHLSSVAA